MVDQADQQLTAQRGQELDLEEAPLEGFAGLEALAQTRHHAYSIDSTAGGKSCSVIGVFGSSAANIA